MKALKTHLLLIAIVVAGVSGCKKPLTYAPSLTLFAQALRTPPASRLDALKVLRKYVTRGKRQFPRNPHFYFYEAESYISRGPMDCPVPKVQQLLNKTQELARALPPGDERDDLLDLVQERQKMIAAQGALGGPAFLDMLHEVFGMDEDEDADDDGY